MKILQVLPYFCFGGAEIMCENLTRAQLALGQDVTVVCLYNRPTPISRRMEQAGVRILWLDKQPGLDLSMVPKLRRVFRQERPHVVHTHLDVIKYAAAAAHMEKIPCCVHTVHSVADKEAEGRIQKWINNAYFRLGWSLPVGLSREVRGSIAEFYGLEKEKIPMIPNGIDLSRCRPKDSYGLGQTVNLVHVGRFDVPKNHEGLLRAFQKLHSRDGRWRLTLVGDGDLRPAMEELARELDILRWVDFCGMRQDVYPYLQQADIFILPSLYEGNPMTIIEAMGTGLPIVASRVGGIPDMLEDGKTGLLVPCQVDAICAACETLAGDENLRQDLGQQARRDSVRFSAQSMARQYCEVYEARLKC